MGKIKRAVVKFSNNGCSTIRNKVKTYKLMLYSFLFVIQPAQMRRQHDTRVGHNKIQVKKHKGSPTTSFTAGTSFDTRVVDENMGVEKQVQGFEHDNPLFLKVNLVMKATLLFNRKLVSGTGSLLCLSWLGQTCFCSRCQSCLILGGEVFVNSD